MWNDIIAWSGWNTFTTWTGWILAVVLGICQIISFLRNRPTIKFFVGISKKEDLLNLTIINSGRRPVNIIRAGLQYSGGLNYDFTPGIEVFHGWLYNMEPQINRLPLNNIKEFVAKHNNPTTMKYIYFTNENGDKYKYRISKTIRNEINDKATSQENATSKMEKVTFNWQDLLFPIELAFSYGFFIVVSFGMVTYLLAEYSKESFQPFQLATVVALIGGSIFAAAFSAKCPDDLRLPFKRAGALFLFATISFIIFGFFQPIDKLGIASMKPLIQVVIPLFFYLGTIPFIIALLITLFSISKLIIHREKGVSNLKSK